MYTVFDEIDETNAANKNSGPILKTKTQINHISSNNNQILPFKAIPKIEIYIQYSFFWVNGQVTSAFLFSFLFMVV